MTIPTHITQDELFLPATAYPPAPSFYQGRSPDEIDERLRHILHLASHATSTMAYVREHIAAADLAKAAAYEAIAAEARSDYLKQLAKDVSNLMQSGAITVSASRR